MNGDLQGKVQRVCRELQQLKYTGVVDEVGLRLGDPVALLPLLHFTLLKFSRHVAQCIHKAGYELQGKTDQKFVENAFRFVRDCFNIKTVLTPQHFLEQGFAERKLILISDVVQACKKIHNDEIRKERLAALKQKQTGGGGAESRLYEPTRKVPDIKIVKAGQEVRQVVQAQHWPGGSDGGQSVYKVKRQVVSPAPSGSRGPATSAGSRSKGHVGGVTLSGDTPTSTGRTHRPGTQLPLGGGQTPVTASRWGLPLGNQAGSSNAATGNDSRAPLGSPLEVTLRPAAAGAPVGGVLGALSTPIHNWFVNPAFNDASPEPDTQRSDAAAGPVVQPWWATAAGALGSSLTFPTFQGAAGGSGVAGSVRFGGQAATNPDHDDDDEEEEEEEEAGTDGLRQLLHHVHGAGGLTGTLGAWGQQQGMVQVVDVQPTSEVVVDASGEEGTADGDEGLGQEGTEGEGEEGQDSLSAAQAYLQGQRTAVPSMGTAAGAWTQPQLQQQHPQYPHVDAASMSMGGRHVGQMSTSHQPQASMSAPQQQAAPAHAEPARPAAGYGLDQLKQLDDRVWAVEKQLLSQLSELAARVTELEKRGEEERAASELASSAQQARITVLEGRVRFLECELEGCVRRGEYLAPAPAAAAATSTHAHSPPSARPAAGTAGPSRGPTTEHETQSDRGGGQPQGWMNTSAAATAAAATYGTGARFSQDQQQPSTAPTAVTYYSTPALYASQPSTSAALASASGYASAASGMGPQHGAAQPYSVRSSLATGPMVAEAPTPSFSFQPSHANAVLQQHVAATQEALARSGAAPAPQQHVSDHAGGSPPEAERANTYLTQGALDNQHPSAGAAGSSYGAGGSYGVSALAAHAPQPYHSQPPALVPAAATSGLGAGRGASVSAGGAAAAEAAPPNFGSTSELISSLFNRYTAAQTFLQDLRSSSSLAKP